MATDGVRIVDGDLAHDTYWGIMDLFDSGLETGAIRTEIPFIERDYGADSDFYHEQFVTAYALAFWEIGELSPDILDEVERVVSVGAGVRVWNGVSGRGDGDKRKKELDKFLAKISQPNLKTRKRKKYRIIENLYFQPNDVLSFKLSNGSFHALICSKVTQQRGQCTYDLVATTYSGVSKPTIADLLDESILGSRIRSGFSETETEILQPGVKNIWEYCKTSKPFILGLAYMLVTHRDMVQMKGKFEKVAEITIKEPFKKDGSYGYKSTFLEFEKIFGDLTKHIATWKYEKFPIQLLCEMASD